jgi:chromosome segregation ATPase
LASTQESLEQLGGAAGTELAGTTEGVASLSARVAGVFESIERLIPGNRQSAAEDLRRISDGLAPVPGELRQLGAQLETTAADLEAADSTMVELEESVGRLADDLEKLAPTVQDLAAGADRLVERVDDAQGRVSVDLWLARIAIIGAVLAIGLLLAGRRAP